MNTAHTSRTTTDSPPRRSHTAGSSTGRRGWRSDLHAIRAAMPHGLGLVLGAAVVVALATAAAGLADYWRNLAANTAADLIGAIVAMYVIIPIAQQPRNDAVPPDAPGAAHADEPAADGGGSAARDDDFAA